ncbi:MAG: rod shape-determining protein MreC [Deltaproteobacteria bacterium]|nr:rod shape-determining protein MreC [Deltaproteobacteria bacterium]
MRISERKLSAFFKKHHTIFVSVALALYSLHLALTYQKDVPRGYIVRETLSVMVTPVERLILAVRGGAVGAWSRYVFLVGLTDENAELQRRILELQDENNRLKEEAASGRRLKDIFEYADAAPFNATAASVTAYGAGLWSRTVTINKGAAAGMDKDLAVITSSGVVGRVIEAGTRSSTVLLATDVRSAIDVFVERSRTKGVVEGNGEDGLILKYIRLDDDVSVGDRILTSGIAGVFPKGLVVGEVVRIEKSKDNFFKYIEVRPAANLATVEDVIVVTDTGFHSND